MNKKFVFRVRKEVWINPERGKPTRVRLGMGSTARASFYDNNNNDATYVSIVIQFWDPPLGAVVSMIIFDFRQRKLNGTF